MNRVEKEVEASSPRSATRDGPSTQSRSSSHPDHLQVGRRDLRRSVAAVPRHLDVSHGRGSRGRSLAKLSQVSSILEREGGVHEMVKRGRSYGGCHRRWRLEHARRRMVRMGNLVGKCLRAGGKRAGRGRCGE